MLAVICYYDCFSPFDAVVVVPVEPIGGKYHHQTRAAFDNKDFPFPVQLSVATFFPSGDESQWLVTLHTSDIRDAGTDASVFIKLIGSGGSSERLWIGEDPECFQQGQDDSFLVTVPENLGELRGIVVGHDGSNPYPGWHLDHVTVTNRGSGEPYNTRLGLPCQMCTL